MHATERIYPDQIITWEENITFTCNYQRRWRRTPLHLLYRTASQASMEVGAQKMKVLFSLGHMTQLSCRHPGKSVPEKPVMLLQKMHPQKCCYSHWHCYRFQHIVGCDTWQFMVHITYLISELSNESVAKCWKKTSIHIIEGVHVEDIRLEMSSNCKIRIWISDTLKFGDFWMQVGSINNKMMLLCFCYCGCIFFSVLRSFISVSIQTETCTLSLVNTIPSCRKYIKECCCSPLRKWVRE